MRSISFLLFILFTSLFGNVDDLTYMSKTSSNTYFADMNDGQINEYCDAHHGGRMEQDFCAKRMFESSERTLNFTYKKIVSKYKSKSIEDKKILNKIQKAQTLWLQYREAECEGQYTVIGDGTMRNEQYFWCKSKLTQIREKELVDFYLDEYK